MDELTVLYDGWHLVYQPAGPAALHLLAILAHLPPEISPVLALPDERPVWLPDGIPSHTYPASDTPRDRLDWEQRTLPRLGVLLGAELVHLTHAHPALFTSIPSLVSPTAWPEPARRGGLIERARASLARGGLARSRGLLWPVDLPLPAGEKPLAMLPPIVHPDFLAAPPADSADEAGLALPETYVFYHGPGERRGLRRLLDAWSWAAAPLSTLYPLVMLDEGSPDNPHLADLLEEYELQETVRVLSAIPPNLVPLIYQRCSAVLHPAPAAPWGGALRHALACGKPIVAMDSPLADELVGPAAYLLPGSESRRLGAALITVIVEEGVAEALSLAASQRVASWDMAAYGARLLSAYRAALTGDRESAG